MNDNIFILADFVLKAWAVGLEYKAVEAKMAEYRKAGLSEREVADILFNWLEEEVAKGEKL